MVALRAAISPNMNISRSFCIAPNVLSSKHLYFHACLSHMMRACGDALQALASRFVGLGAEVLSGGTALEEAGEERLDDGAEDDLGTPVILIRYCVIDA